MTRVEFLQAFPEFCNTDVSYIDAKLSEAGRRIDRTVWNANLADDGQGNLCAHLLAISPYGNTAKMVAKDGTTTYGKEHKRLLGIATAGLRST